MTQSRRQLLSLAVSAVAARQAAAAAPLESPNRQYVTRYELVLGARGSFRARLGTTGGRAYEVDLDVPDSVDPFIKMVEMALANKGRLALEIDNDNRTVRSFRLELP
jgi:hypothetical protein